MDRSDTRRIPLEQYFLRRLEEESALAQASPTRAERDAHLRACQLLRELLDLEIDADFHLRHPA